MRSVLLFRRALCYHYFSFFFFFNDTATTEIYTLSLHDALPISELSWRRKVFDYRRGAVRDLREALFPRRASAVRHVARSEEHTSELQSHLNLVCRLLLEKKKNKHTTASATSTAASHISDDILSQ